jgi:hypothetical protein
MVLLQPEFEIDNKNRVVCKYHTDYLQFLIHDRDFFDELYLEQKLTCFSCDHYKLDECYFRKSLIEKIENERKMKKTFKCRLCGRKIERLFCILYSLYYKENFSVDIPLICCNCYDLLNNKEFLLEIKKILYIYLFVIFTSFYFLFYSIFFISILNLLPMFNILILVSTTFIISSIIIKLLNKLKYRINGLRFFKKNFLNKGIR